MLSGNGLVIRKVQTVLRSPRRTPTGVVADEVVRIVVIGVKTKFLVVSPIDVVSQLCLLRPVKEVRAGGHE